MAYKNLYHTLRASPGAKAAGIVPFEGVSQGSGGDGAFALADSEAHFTLPVVAATTLTPQSANTYDKNEIVSLTGDGVANKIVKATVGGVVQIQFPEEGFVNTHIESSILLHSSTIGTGSNGNFTLFLDWYDSEGTLKEEFTDTKVITDPISSQEVCRLNIVTGLLPVKEDDYFKFAVGVESSVANKNARYSIAAETSDAKEKINIYYYNKDTETGPAGPAGPQGPPGPAGPQGPPGSGGGGGLDTAAVDERIAPWARQGNLTEIPLSKFDDNFGTRINQEDIIRFFDKTDLVQSVQLFFDYADYDMGALYITGGDVIFFVPKYLATKATIGSINTLQWTRSTQTLAYDSSLSINIHACYLYKWGKEDATPTSINANQAPSVRLDDNSLAYFSGVTFKQSELKDKDFLIIGNTLKASEAITKKNMPVFIPWKDYAIKPGVSLGTFRNLSEETTGGTNTDITLSFAGDSVVVDVDTGNDDNIGQYARGIKVADSLIAELGAGNSVTYQMPEFWDSNREFKFLCLIHKAGTHENVFIVDIRDLWYSEAGVVNLRTANPTISYNTANRTFTFGKLSGSFPFCGFIKLAGGSFGDFEEIMDKILDQKVEPSSLKGTDDKVPDDRLPASYSDPKVDKPSTHELDFMCQETSLNTMVDDKNLTFVQDGAIYKVDNPFPGIQKITYDPRTTGDTNRRYVVFVPLSIQDDDVPKVLKVGTHTLSLSYFQSVSGSGEYISTSTSRAADRPVVGTPKSFNIQTENTAWLGRGVDSRAGKTISKDTLRDLMNEIRNVHQLPSIAKQGLILRLLDDVTVPGVIEITCGQTPDGTLVAWNGDGSLGSVKGSEPEGIHSFQNYSNNSATNSNFRNKTVLNKKSGNTKTPSKIKIWFNNLAVQEFNLTVITGNANSFSLNGVEGAFLRNGEMLGFNVDYTDGTKEVADETLHGNNTYRGNGITWTDFDTLSRDDILALIATFAQAGNTADKLPVSKVPIQQLTDTAFNALTNEQKDALGFSYDV